MESIQCQLDSVIVSVDYDTQNQFRSTSSSVLDELSMTRQSIRENVAFCDRALDQVLQLKNVLMINLNQLHSIVESYDHAYPEQKTLVSKFMAANRKTVYKLTEELEQCQADVKARKEYLEPQLTIVGWKDLMKPQYKQFTLFALAHFIIFLLAIAALAWFAGYRDRYIGLFYLYRGPMFLTLYFYFYSLNLVGWATARINYINIHIWFLQC